MAGHVHRSCEVDLSPQKGSVISTVSLSRLTRCHRLGAFESIPLRRFMFMLSLQAPEVLDGFGSNAPSRWPRVKRGNHFELGVNMNVGEVVNSNALSRWPRVKRGNHSVLGMNMHVGEVVSSNAPSRWQRVKRYQTS
jgi:hypothetical protein